jgi:hypothetical protein
MACEDSPEFQLQRIPALCGSGMPGDQGSWRRTGGSLKKTKDQCMRKTVDRLYLILRAPRSLTGFLHHAVSKPPRRQSANQAPPHSRCGRGDSDTVLAR